MPENYKSNCLIFALKHWWEKGGYLIIRKSHYGWWPHFLWSADLKTFEQFTPLRKAQRHLFPPLIFVGYVEIGFDLARR
jgi:hypothetical protein